MTKRSKKWHSSVGEKDDAFHGVGNNYENMLYIRIHITTHTHAELYMAIALIHNTSRN